MAAAVTLHPSSSVEGRSTSAAVGVKAAEPQFAIALLVLSKEWLSHWRCVVGT